MKEFTLMTDVNTDVEPEYAAKEGIVIMPHYYYFEDGIIYGDEIKLEPDEFYKRLANGEVAKSSGCNPGKVREMFEAELDKGKDILAIICTSGLSGSFNTCHSVADELMEERFREKKENINIINKMKNDLNETIKQNIILKDKIDLMIKENEVLKKVLNEYRIKTNKN